ncbi:AbiV family abortive infection protein [Abyssalbus ytuae]|uniref:AbiV family abortive infection protein n=1 Tax=Abyssalbus ytuae TaxID=2926907 RepID=A0A9E6ZYG0_9FLAO|nr:AbiV family abortive infection protein [Abyssalbus ytuae]UOB17512.1 AbiV family abortive infection protein [Abyssalbus ytuae]
MVREKGNKSFMNLSKKECLKVAKETFRNADSMYNDGVHLAKNDSFGRATSLLILSMEENMKALILYLDGNGFEFRSRVKGIKSLFNNHKLRYPLALVLSGFNIFGKDIKEIITKIKTNPTEIQAYMRSKNKWESLAKVYLLKKIKQFISEILWFSNAEYLRQEGMYVDYDIVMKTPLDINKQDYQDVYYRINGMREFIVDFLPIFDERNEEGDLELKAHLIKLQKELISEKGYERIGELLSKFNNKKLNPLEALLENVQELETDLTEDF